MFYGLCSVRAVILVVLFTCTTRKLFGFVKHAEFPLQFSYFVTRHLLRCFYVILWVVLWYSYIFWHVDGRYTFVLPVLGHSCPGEGGLSRYVWNFKFWVCLLSLDETPQVQPHSWIDYFWLSWKQIVIKRASFHDALACFSRNPNAELHVQDIWIEILPLDVWLHGLDGVLHWETTLSSLGMGFQMVEPAVVVVAVSGWVCGEECLLGSGETSELCHHV